MRVIIHNYDESLNLTAIEEITSENKEKLQEYINKEIEDYKYAMIKNYGEGVQFEDTSTSWNDLGVFCDVQAYGEFQESLRFYEVVEKNLDNEVPE